MALEIGQVVGHCLALQPAIPNRRRFGVPVRGAFDVVAFELALALLGEGPPAEVWECFGGFSATCIEPITVAAVGVCCTLSVNGRSFPSNRSFTLRPGDRLSVPSAKAWGPLYVAWTASRPSLQTAKLADPPFSQEPGPLCVQPGPDGLPCECLFEGHFTVDIRSDRRGIRLAASLRPLESLPASIPITPGTIQLPPGGAPIIIGPDGPTIGGYPILGVIAEADLPRLAYLEPGKPVEFKRFERDECGTSQEFRTRIARLAAEIRAAVKV